MNRAGVLAAAALAAAGCASSRSTGRGKSPSPPPSAPQAKPGAAAAATPAPQEAAIVFGNAPVEPSVLEEMIRAHEAAASQSAQPAERLTGAASTRRLLAEEAMWAPDEALRAASRNAMACTDDAHRAWMSLEPEAAAAANAGKSLGEVLARVGPRAAYPLYLEAVCSAVWARAQGFTPLIERRDDLKQMLARVAQLAPDLDEAGAERELGKLYAALPAYAGGDLRAARAHFEAALLRAPSSARTRIVFARTVGVKAQDRALFEAQLQAAAAAKNPDLAGEARELLAREDELFGPAEAAQPIPGGPTR